MSRRKEPLVVTARTASFGKWVAGVRLARGLYQSQFDEKYGVSRTLLGALEKGEWDPEVIHARTFEKLAIGLDVDITTVLKKAGYHTGDDHDPDLITRVHRDIQEFLKRESVIREGISHAIVILGTKDEDVLTARAVDEDIALRKLGYSLGSFDLLTEQLKKRRTGNGDGDPRD